jgi:hypothetical protein
MTLDLSQNGKNTYRGVSEQGAEENTWTRGKK